MTKAIALVVTLTVGFTIGLTVRPTIHQVETFVRTETIQHPSTADQLRDVLIRTDNLNEDLPAALAYECTLALIHHTDADIASSVVYIERRWQGDACAALDHYLEYGYY